jgi:diguanylate cyclase (GGDEF)-like protein
MLIQKNTVLIIDDDAFLLAALTAILQPLHEVIVAKSGEEGIEKARNMNVDIILLDVIMRGMSGHETMSVLQQDEKTKSIPVIFLTGLDKQDEEVRALNAGAVDYIRKPVQEEVVKLRVGNQLKLLNQMRIIERFSLTDGLTGANNRRNYDQQLEAEWHRCARNKAWLSMVMCDIDNFKIFNDTHGHLAGDHALKTLATMLTSSAQRDADSVYRWGGEEFVILLPEMPLEGALAIAERARRIAEATPIVWNKEVLHVTISAGVATVVPKSGTYPMGAMEFCRDADAALYRAKAEGRNRVVVAETSVSRAAAE